MARYGQMAKTLGMKVRQLRFQRRDAGLPWSQAWLAQAAGCSRQTIIFVEAGTFRNPFGEYRPYTPGQALLEDIAAALGVSVNYLLGE